MSDQPKVKITPIPIPDGFLTEVDGEFALTQIQVGEETMTVDDFMSALEGGMELEKITISRSEKRSKTKYETYEYFVAWDMRVSKMTDMLSLVPNGDQKRVARQAVGKMLTRRIQETEEFLSRALHSAQQKDMIQPYWRENQKPIF